MPNHAQVEHLERTQVLNSQVLESPISPSTPSSNSTWLSTSKSTQYIIDIEIDIDIEIVIDFNVDITAPLYG